LKQDIQEIFEGFLIITGLYFLGEFISNNFLTPLPGNIIGLLLMVTFLALGIVPVSKVERFAEILLDNLILIFIPLNVSIVTIWSLLRAEGIKILLVNLVTTLLVLALTGWATKMFIVKGDLKNVDSHDK